MSTDSPIEVRVHPDVHALIGVVHARSVSPGACPTSLDEAVRDHVSRRGDPLDPDDEAVRTAVRDMLRHGRYRPTGRGKPASEYLLRAAREGDFPRINAPVDVCNVVSVGFLLPISVWDVDRAGSDRYLVRHGSAGESYVFNTAGQDIGLEDLLLGARLGPDAGPGEPVVNPVKDSMVTKTNDSSTHVAALLYAPAGHGDRLGAAVDRFAALLSACGDDVRVRTAIVRPSESVEV